MTQTKIKVIGIGGSGINALNRMIHSGIKGIDFLAVDTDEITLEKSNASEKLQLGNNYSIKERFDKRIINSEEATEASKEELKTLLKGYNMAFIVCGLSLGAGTGAAPIIARIAKELGILTIAVVTTPFDFEGGRIKALYAQIGIEKLKNNTDSLIVINNNKIDNEFIKNTKRNSNIRELFDFVDETLLSIIRAAAGILYDTGMINVDFNDIKSILKNSGATFIGIGIASGEDKAKKAANLAINSKYSDYKINNARRIIINVIGGNDMTLNDATEAASLIQDIVADDAKIIFGANVNEKFEKDEIQVTIIATGFNDNIDIKCPFLT